MANRNFNTAIIIRLCCLVGLSMAASYLIWVKDLVFWGLILFLAVIGLAVETLIYFNRVNRWISSFLLGIENEDTTLKMPKKTGNRSIDEVFTGLNRLNEIFRNIKIEIGTQEAYYLSIINQSATGLFSVDELGRIININPSAEKLTGLVAFQHVNTLARINPSLPDFIMNQKNIPDSDSTICENKFGQKLLFKLSPIKTPSETIKLVIVSDITKELDLREVDAWIKLARTLSHEIMNNIAPITTLSHVTLNFFVRNDKAISPDSIKQETVDQTIKGLRVIKERSSGLKKFVENYRKFTKLPEPELKKVDLVPLVGKVLLISREFNGSGHIDIEETLPESLVVITDEDLLTQVLINLIKNAMESYGEPKKAEKPTIKIKLEESGNTAKIEVCNNGEQIPPEIKEQIFVPFFTTKENGTGIGLSLSKQIMLKLGGDIILKGESKNQTCFSISLPR